MKKTIFITLSKIYRLCSSSFLNNIPKIGPILDLLYDITNPNEIVLIKMMKTKIFVNSGDVGVASPLLKFGIYEEYETEIFKNLIKSDTIFIDIGANIGYYTLIAASKIKIGKIYSFEPVPTNFKLLSKNVKINNYSNIKLIQKAVSDNNGNVKIFLDKTNLGNHSLTQHNVVTESNFIEVKTIKLDSLFYNFKDIVKEDILIKIDTQGAEGLVIAGAQNTLLKTNIKILMEFWPKGLRNMGTDPLELLNKLHNYGFKFRLLDEKSKSLQKFNKRDIIDYCDNNDDGIDQVNLLLEKGN
jgi:FkbM family methyltransferase